MNFDAVFKVQKEMIVVGSDLNFYFFVLDMSTYLSFE
jgi:hypothetical protein